jgi:hypothetical protein
MVCTEAVPEFPPAQVPEELRLTMLTEVDTIDTVELTIQPP